MKYRSHAGTLAEAMKTVVELPATREDLAAHITTILWHPIQPSDLEVKPYAYDYRIGWDTHIVTWRGDAVGFTDGPLEE